MNLLNKIENVWRDATVDGWKKNGTNQSTLGTRWKIAQANNKSAENESAEYKKFGKIQSTVNDRSKIAQVNKNQAKWKYFAENQSA